MGNRAFNRRILEMAYAGDPRINTYFIIAVLALLAVAAVFGLIAYYQISKRKESDAMAEEIMEKCGVDKDRLDD